MSVVEGLPDRISDYRELDDLLCLPSEALIRDLASVDGDILVLGVGGKMGLTVAGVAKAAAPHKRVIGVARFSEPAIRDELERRGVETIACDLLNAEEVAKLPKTSNVIFMAGMKFGAADNPSMTWAMNVLVPAIVAQEFHRSRIVAFSTGCVYPFVSVDGPGCDEGVAPNPPGEYAQSCVGRERIFEYYSRTFGTPGRLFRLNYAIDMRYGVLHDIARKVALDEPIDVTMGHVNVIWQGDAASQALRSLRHCTTPTSPINVSGPEILAVRDLAEEFGRAFGRGPRLTGREAPTAWLTNTTQAQKLFGRPLVGIEQMKAWTVDWIKRDMPSYGKPTKFEVRDGAY